MVKGFTLIELMVTLAISAIVLTFSVSGLANIQQRQEVSADVNSFVRLIDLARSNSIKNRKQTTICPYSADNSCGNSWQKIHLLEPLISGHATSYQLVFNSHYKKIEWRAFQNKNNLSFTSLGFTAHQNGTLFLCHKTSHNLNRAISVSKSGRATIKKKSSKLNQVCG